MRVDEAGRHDTIRDVEHQPDLVRAHDPEIADREDPVAEHADIGTPSRDPRAIDDGPAPKEQVEAGHASNDATAHHPPCRVRPPPLVDSAFRGAIAQLEERLHGMQKVRGSSPRSSTMSDRRPSPLADGGG